MTDRADLYAAERHALAAAILELDDAALSTRVPATPAWTVADVVAHLTGIVADVLDQNLAGRGADEWTGEQVESRRGRPVEVVLEEWAARAPDLEALLRHSPPVAGAIIGDLAAHTIDLSDALPGRTMPTPGPDTLLVAIEHYATQAARRLDERNEGAVSITLRPDDEVATGRCEWLLGSGEPAATVRVGALDALRVLTGRLGREAAAALAWDNAPGPALDALPDYGWRPDPI